jgi:hypothetical protein
MTSTGVNAPALAKSSALPPETMAELALFLDLTWTLRPGPEGTPRERSRAANQLFSMLRTALDRL